jgi:hypothetical protein
MDYTYLDENDYEGDQLTVQFVSSLMHSYLAFHPSLFSNPFLVIQSPNSVPFTLFLYTNLSEGCIIIDLIRELSSWLRK